METIKDQFVSYEIAKEFKELGYDEPCLGYYYIFEHENCFLISTIVNRNSEWDNGFISAPLWQQAIDWFRENHDIIIMIERNHYNDTFINSYTYMATCHKYQNKELKYVNRVRNVYNNHIFNSYDEALKASILKAIELIKQPYI
jgi:hypothetical protein